MRQSAADSDAASALPRGFDSGVRVGVISEQGARIDRRI
jgi:hypothetical protein